MVPVRMKFLRPFTVVSMAALLAVAGYAQTSPQAGAVDQALIQEFAKAASDEARAALLSQHPALADDAYRRALSTLGGGMLQRRELASAERTYRSLLWLGEVTRKDRTRAGALSGLGSVEGQRGNLLRALALLGESLTLGEPLGEADLLQPVYSSLGIVQRRLGEYDKATASFDRALVLARELKRDDMVARVYNNIGAMHLSRGRLDMALEFFQKSLDLKKDDGGRGTVDMATSLNNIGAVHEELGDYARALPYFTRARDLMEKIGAPAGAVTALGNIGHARAALGQVELARQAFEQALTLAETAGDGNAAATILYNLGHLARDGGDVKGAEVFQRLSLAMRKAGGDVAGLTESHAEVAQLLLMQGRLAEAEAEALLSVSVAGSAGQLGHLARAQLYLGQTYERQGRFDLALATFEAGIATVEALREATPPGERARQVFLAERLGPYYSVASLHARAGQGAAGLEAVERVRARTLLDILATGRPAKRALTDAERDKENELAVRALSASVQLMEAQRAPTRSPAAVAAVEETLRSARQEREAFTSALYASRPELRIIRGDAPVITHRQLAEIVTPGSAAIEFVLEPDRVWAYLVQPGPQGVTVTVKPLALDTTALVSLASRFASQVARRDLAFASSSSALYAALFGVFDGHLDTVRHLIIVPDGALWRVPFQALQTPRGKFLIEERAVSYAPSLSALAVLLERRTRRSAAQPFMLALGDPANPAAGRLPEAAREVQSIGRLYGPERSAVFVDQAATESAFRSAVAKASVIHVATHGVLDDNNPMYSHVKLAAGAATDPATDGRLEAWELLDIKINADVAVLSACQTASGAIGGGEGVVGLSWALFAAGASTAVVSQWEVDSASTTSLMIDFHRRLLTPKSAGAATSDALRESAINLMQDPKFRHPFYWAGFVVIGAR